MSKRTLTPTQVCWSRDFTAVPYDEELLLAVCGDGDEGGDDSDATVAYGWLDTEYADENDETPVFCTEAFGDLRSCAGEVPEEWGRAVVAWAYPSVPLVARTRGKHE